MAVIIASWQVRSDSWGRRDLFAVMRLSWKKRFGHKAEGTCVKNCIFKDALVGWRNNTQSKRQAYLRTQQVEVEKKKDTAERESRKRLENTNVDR